MGKFNGPVPILISILGHVFVTPVVIILGLLNELVRLLLGFYLYLKYAGKVKLVPDGADGVWATKRQGSTRNLLLCIRFVRKYNIEEAFKTYEKVFLEEKDEEGNLVYDKLQHILISKLGYACWKRDEDFNFRNHFRVINDPDKVVSKEGLKELLVELQEDVSGTKPQWELVIVPRYKDEEHDQESMWLIARFNHSYGDGLSILMLANDHFTKGFDYFIDPLNFKVPFWPSVLYYLNAIFFSYYSILYVIMNSFKQHWHLYPPSPGEQIKRNYTWTREICFDYIRTIRQATNRVPISAVIQNAFISASKQVLLENRMQKDWEISELAAMLPYPDHKPRNRFTAYLYTIDSSLEDYQRLKQTKMASWESMMGPFIVMGFFSLKAIGRMPIYFHSLFLRLLTGSMYFSNVPCSKSRVIGTQDVDVIQLVAFPPQPNDTGIIVCNLSYEKSLRVHVTADTSWLNKEELENIVERIPDIIEDWAYKAEKLLAQRKGKQE